MFKPKKCNDCGDMIMEDGRCWSCRPERADDVPVAQPKGSSEALALIAKAQAIKAAKGITPFTPRPDAPTVQPVKQAPHPIPAVGAFDRNAYHRAYMREYMREYMRKRRAAAKAST